MNRTSISFDIRKENWNNKFLFPDIIYIDTCAIIDIFMERKHGSLTEQYIHELINRDGMITWSQHTVNEIIQFVHVDTYSKIAKKKNITGNKAWKIAENIASDEESRKAAETTMNKVYRIIEYLEQFGMQTDVDIANPQCVETLTTELYLGYGGNQYDARHVAIANISGVNNILTQDGGYLRYPSLNIFGASKELVSNYNMNQSPNPYLDLSRSILHKEFREELDQENAK
ncbi:hypothetical protein [Anoxybacillus ayderensis]|uniref:hypothetical protein n=1 Tax=Anoxybacillus ayderensis TaxID=265546 RepID=UPI002E1E82C6|nr:hypothetical protein [Anoxybacillus ayderensis]